MKVATSLFGYGIKRILRGFFVFFYSDESRRNAKYKDLQVINVYFELNAGISPRGSGTVQVNCMTDLCLNVERHAQWIFESYMREAKSIY